jgi:putative permease
MIKVLHDFYKRYFSEEEAIIFTGLLIVLVTILMTMGGIIAPLLWSLIITYLLQGLVNALDRWQLPHGMGVYLVYFLFIGVLALVIFVLLPFTWNSMASLLNNLPQMIDQLRDMLLRLPNAYPDVFTSAQVEQWLNVMQQELGILGQQLLSNSFSSFSRVVTLTIYTILVPIMVFFMLKDSSKLLAWLEGWLPEKRPIMAQIWHEMNDQLSNYVRGKALEILLVGGSCLVLFTVLGLRYPLLLSVLVGFSIIIPYVGAKVVAIPVFMVGFFQWGFSPDFYHLVVAYVILLVLDGYVLVPLLFSETVFLHPIAIIAAVLVFGGLWGFWGVFFAIPLATFIKAILNAWPISHHPLGGPPHHPH